MTTYYGPGKRVTDNGETAAAPRLLSISLPQKDAPAENLQLAHLAIEEAPSGMLIVDTETLDVKLANRKAREMYEQVSGRPISSLYGRTLTELEPWLDDHHLAGQLQRVADLGQPLYGQLLELEVGAGQESPGALEYDIVPLAGAAGSSHDVLVTVRDATHLLAQKRRAEATTFAAQQRTEMLENIFEQIAEGVVVRARDGRVMVYNLEALRLSRNQSAVEQGRTHGQRVAPEWEFLDSVSKPIPKPELPEWRVMLTGSPLLSAHLLLRKRGTVPPSF